MFAHEVKFKYILYDWSEIKINDYREHKNLIKGGKKLLAKSLESKVTGGRTLEYFLLYSKVLRSF